jgi:hypothetical protein
MRKLPLEDEYSNEMKVASSTIPLSSSKKSTSVKTPVAVPVQPESQTPVKSKTVSARAESRVKWADGEEERRDSA